MRGKTHEQYYKLYEETCRAFEAVAVGENSVVRHKHLGLGIVIEKQPDFYRSYHEYSESDGSTLKDLIGHYYHSGAGQAQKDEYYAFSNHMHWDVDERRPAALLDNLNGIFKLIDPCYKETARKEKLKYLTAALKTMNPQKLRIEGRQPDRELIDKFLIKFNYHKIFLKRFPEIKTIELPSSMREKYHCSPLRFYDPSDEDSIVTFHKKEILRPERGKQYVMHERYLNEPLVKEARGTGAMEIIYYFYEKILPEIFTRLGLKFKRVKITRNDYGHPLTSTAWLIIDGLDKLQQEPFASFAHGASLKADCEILPHLTAALKKFGLPPEKLTITNDWLAAAADNCLGSYNAARDEVTLSTPSLSLAAHEGLHRLIKKGLVPAREYQCLVQAGKRLARQMPAAWAQRQPHNSGPAAPPEEEYAAWFVETYYEKNTMARKCLVGAPVPIFEQIMGYVRECWEILAARLGNNAALARQFLRRIERGQIGPAAHPRRKFCARRPPPARRAFSPEQSGI